MTSPFRMLRWILVGLAVLLPVVAVLLSPDTMSWLRSDYRWLGVPLNWLDEYSTPWFDLTHIVLFAGITGCVACLWARVAWWRLAGLMLALGVVTEVMQYGVPGRTPRLSDLLDDLLGIGVGLVLAVPLRQWARRGPSPAA